MKPNQGKFLIVMKMFSVVLLTLFICRLAGAQAPPAVRDPADALPPMADAQISAVIGMDDTAYHALRESRGFRLNNERHRLSAKFTPSGVTFHQAGQEWGMALVGIGYGNHPSGAVDIQPQGNNNRVEYRRGTTTEWYVNGPLGIEQGF